MLKVPPSLFMAIIAASLLMVLGPTAESATAVEASRYRLALGSFVGGGTTNDAATRLVASNGYSLSMERAWFFPSAQDAEGGVWSLAPRLEWVYDYSSIAMEGSGNVAGERYEQRGDYNTHVLAAGFSLSYALHPRAEATRLYFAIMGGRGLSQLRMDEDTSTRSRETEYSGIEGNYASIEGGVWWSLRQQMGLHIAALHHIYQVEQAAATGVFAEQKDENGLSLTDGKQTAVGSGLPEELTFYGLALKVALVVGF